MLYDNKSDHDLSSIYCKILCESTGDKNEKLLAQAQAMGANNPISPDQTSQTRSYNAHKNQK